MAKMRKWKLEREFVQVPNETALAPEETISLQALGLIVNLWSYNTETWELHKTELYKRYVKNKEASVKTAWNELMEAGYIIEYKYRAGKKWEYEYYYRITPFTAEERAEILEYAKQEHGEIWGLDFQDLKMKTSKPRDNKDIINKKFNQQKEEEELTTVITESYILSLMQSKINEFEITNEKTIKAAFIAVSKCKQIGGTDHKAAENYVIKVVEEKMGKLGQKQKVKQPKQRTGRKEQVSESVRQQLAEQEAKKQPVTDQEQLNTAALEEERRRLEEELKIYQRA